MPSSSACVFADDYDSFFPAEKSMAEAPVTSALLQKENPTQSMGRLNPRLLREQGQEPEKAMDQLSWGPAGSGKVRKEPDSLVKEIEKGRSGTRRGSERRMGWECGFHSSGERIWSHRSLEMAVEATRSHMGLEQWLEVSWRVSWEISKFSPLSSLLSALLSPGTPGIGLVAPASLCPSLGA